MARTYRGLKTKVFTATTSPQDLALTDAEAEALNTVTKYPDSCEFQTVGNYGLTGADGTDFTYANVVAGKEKVCTFTTLLATNDATNPTASGAVLVCTYN